MQFGINSAQLIKGPSGASVNRHRDATQSLRLLFLFSLLHTPLRWCLSAPPRLILQVQRLIPPPDISAGGV